MKRSFAALLVGALSLCSLACTGGVETAPLEAKRIAGWFFAFGTSPKFNQPNSRGEIPCDGALKLLDNSLFPSFVTLHRLDGNDWTCVRRFTAANADRPHEVRVYLFYHVSDQPDLLELQARKFEVMQEFAAVANDFSELSMAMTLEDRLSDEKFAEYALELEIQNLHVIERNPLSPDAEAGGRPMEAHGTGALCVGDTDTASLDGFVLAPEQMLSWVHDNAACERLILWTPELQGLCVVDGKPVKCVPVPDRDIIIPNPEQLAELTREASL